MYSVFHVSMLKKYMPEISHKLQHKKLDVRPYQSYEEEAMRIFNRYVKNLHRKEVPLVKEAGSWGGHMGCNSTFQDSSLRRTKILGTSTFLWSIWSCAIVWLCICCHGMWLWVYPLGKFWDIIFLSGWGLKFGLFALGFSSQYGCYPDQVSWVQPFLAWFKYDTLYGCPALASFGFGTCLRFNQVLLDVRIESLTSLVIFTVFGPLFKRS